MKVAIILNPLTNFKLLVYIIIFLTSGICLAQQDPIFIKFESCSEKTFQKENGSGQLVEENLFQKSVKENEDVHFFVEELLFIHEKSKMENIILSNSNPIIRELLSPEEIKAHILKIQKKYPLGYKYPSPEFPKLYMAERGKDSIVLYEVKWQYYIE